MTGDERAFNRLVLVAIVAAVLLAYAASLRNGFVFDDDFIIVKNPQTLSFRSVPSVLFSPDVVKPYYRPLNRLGYLLDYRIFGMKPSGFHAVNLLVHGATAVLLYLVARRLLAGRWPALFAALLFAVHPANSEAVNFVSARNTLLATFFSLAALLAWWRARDRAAQWPVLSAVLFFCGLLSKETGFMLAAVVGALVVVPSIAEESPRREPWRSRLASLAPFGLATLVYGAMRAYSLQGVLGAQPDGTSLLQRLAGNYSIIPQYLGLLFVPLDLTLFHDAAPTRGFFALPGVVPVIWLLLVGAAGLVLARGSRAARFGLLWAAVNYLPIANIVPIPSESITERFLYLPAVGFFLLAGAGLQWLGQRRQGAVPAVVAGALALAVCGVLTFQRTIEWRDDLSLFASGVRNDPRSVGARFNLGTALKDAGDLTGAEREWRRALELDPRHADTLAQMGTLAAVRGNFAPAEEYYRAALVAPPGKSDPDRAMAHYNLGKICERVGKPSEALAHYGQFLRRVTSYYQEYAPEVEQRIARLRAAQSARDTAPSEPKTPLTSSSQ